jgi:hypothetical protein
MGILRDEKSAQYQAVFQRYVIATLLNSLYDSSARGGLIGLLYDSSTRGVLDGLLC